MTAARTWPNGYRCGHCALGNCSRCQVRACTCVHESAPGASTRPDVAKATHDGRKLPEASPARPAHPGPYAPRQGRAVDIHVPERRPQW